MKRISFLLKNYLNKIIKCNYNYKSQNKMKIYLDNLYKNIYINQIKFNKILTLIKYKNELKV